MVGTGAYAKRNVIVLSRRRSKIGVDPCRDATEVLTLGVTGFRLLSGREKAVLTTFLKLILTNKENLCSDFVNYVVSMLAVVCSKDEVS